VGLKVIPCFIFIPARQKRRFEGTRLRSLERHFVLPQAGHVATLSCRGAWEMTFSSILQSAGVGRHLP
jgi:hypothetical protein